MTMQENVQTVTGAFAAIGCHDPQGFLVLSAEDIEWVIPDEWPQTGTQRGHAGLADLLQKASEVVDTSISKPIDIAAQRGRVLVLGFAKGSIRTTNRTFEDHFVLATTVMNFREYIDTLALARVSETAANPGP